MSRFKSHSVFILSSLLLGSCSATQSSMEVPALLVQPSENNRMALEHAIGTLFNSQPIKLADSIFTQKSTVIIETNQPKDSHENVLNGRDIRQADTVSLLIKGDKCYVRHDQSGLIELVKSISCRASGPQ